MKATAKDVYFVDTNIVMYAVGADHAMKQPCLQIFADSEALPLMLTTSTEVLQELLHVYSARGQRQLAIEICRDFVETVDEILPVTYNDFSWALQFHHHHSTIMARDSIHAATIVNNGLSYILTADKHFDKLPGITRIDPREWPTHLASVGLALH